MAGAADGEWSAVIDYYGASTGSVENAPEAGKRKPSTLIGEVGGASNSMVPV